MNPPPPQPDAMRHAAEYAAARARAHRRWAALWAVVALAACCMWVISFFRVPHQWWSFSPHVLWVDLWGEAEPTPVADGLLLSWQPLPISVPRERAARVEVVIEVAVPLAKVARTRRRGDWHRPYEPWSPTNPPPAATLERAIASAVAVRVAFASQPPSPSHPITLNDAATSPSPPPEARARDGRPLTLDDARRAALEQAARAFEGKPLLREVPAAIRAGGTPRVPLPFFKTGPLWGGWWSFLAFGAGGLAILAMMRSWHAAPGPPLEHVA